MCGKYVVQDVKDCNLPFVFYLFFLARLSRLPNHRPTSWSVFTSSFLNRKHDLVANEKEESYSRLKKFHVKKEKSREDRYWSMREKSSAYQGNPGVDRSLRMIRDANEVSAQTMDRLDTDVRFVPFLLLSSLKMRILLVFAEDTRRHFASKTRKIPRGFF